ncbi:MAG: serine hydrolase [Dehalococcoidia bacterium]|nr:MAG: serine hydrolase [Dehalococcoidia bacterium]
MAFLAIVALGVGCSDSPEVAPPESVEESAGSPTPLPTTERPVTPSLSTPAALQASPRAEEAETPSPEPSQPAAPSPQPSQSVAAVWCADEELLTGPTDVPLSLAYAPMPSHRDAALEEVIRSSLGDEVDSYGVVVKNLVNGAAAEVNPHKSFESASLFKLWVMYEVYKQVELGLVDMGEELLVTPYYASWDAGTLPVEVCDTLTVRHALWAMITYSDNTSGFLLLDRVGPGNINRDLQALGLTESAFREEDVISTAADMALFLEMVVLGAAVSREASGEMLDLLLAQKVRDRLPALLPSGAGVANKTGNLPEVTHDVGIVYDPQPTYIIAVLSEKGGEPEPIAVLSRAVYDYFSH